MSAASKRTLVAEWWELREDDDRDMHAIRYLMRQAGRRGLLDWRPAYPTLRLVHVRRYRLARKVPR